MSSEIIVRGGLPGKIRIEVCGQFIEVDNHLTAYSALQEVAPWLAEVLAQPVALIVKPTEVFEPVVPDEPFAAVESILPPPAKLPSTRPSRAPK